MRHGFHLGLLASALCAGFLAAQADSLTTNQAEAAKNRAALTNLSVPEIPAFSFLGATPTNIARPGGARAFGAALLQGVDASGKVKQGFALEILPLLQVGKTTLQQYQSSLWARIRSNLQFSIGTARAAGDSASTDMGIGLRATLLDQGDPLADRAFVARVDALTDECAPSDPTATNVKETSRLCMEGKVSKAAATWNTERWNASAWIVAVAAGTQLEQSKLADRRSLGWRAWTTYGLGVSDWGLLLLHASFDDNQVAADSSYKAVSGGIRLLIGGPRLNGFAEVSQQKRWDTKLPIEKKPATWSGGLEFPAGKDFWISAGMGKAYEQVKAPDRVFVFANIKWGVSGKSRLEPK